MVIEAWRASETERERTESRRRLVFEVCYIAVPCVIVYGYDVADCAWSPPYLIIIFVEGLQFSCANIIPYRHNASVCDKTKIMK